MKEENLSKEELKETLKGKSEKSKKQEFQVVRMGTRDRSVEGIESLFMEYGLIEPKMDPNIMIDKMLKNRGLLDIE